MKVRGEGGNWKFQQGKGIHWYYHATTGSRSLITPAKLSRDHTVTTGRLWHRVGYFHWLGDKVEHRGPSTSPIFFFFFVSFLFCT